MVGTYTELTLSSLDDFEESFPDSDYLTEVGEMRDRETVETALQAGIC